MFAWKNYTKEIGFLLFDTAFACSPPSALAKLFEKWITPPKTVFPELCTAPVKGYKVGQDLLSKGWV